MEELIFLKNFILMKNLLSFYIITRQDNLVDYNVELILNGDILNLIQVDYRGHYLSVITESVTLEKNQRIVAGHPKFLML